MELSAIAKATYSALDKQAERVNPDKAWWISSAN